MNVRLINCEEVLKQDKKAIDSISKNWWTGEDVGIIDTVSKSLNASSCEPSSMKTQAR